MPVGNFTAPIAVASPPGDTARLFVVERGGAIRVVKNGVALSTPFLTIPSSQLSTDGERGLLSMAFAADYEQSGRVYTYSSDAAGDIRLDLWQRSSDPDVASPSRSLVLQIEHSSRNNHYGGGLHAGPDGLLYVSTGDGGGADDPDANGQTLIRSGTPEQQSTALLGKLLRIAPGTGGGYTIPATNPFAGRTDARGEIYAYGLRNPFRFSLDRTTGDLLLADVGQDDAEEVNYSTTGGRGANFGWKCYEGAQQQRRRRPSVRARRPRAAGLRVRPRRLPGHYGRLRRPRSRTPSLAGRYVYADYCVGEIRSIAPSTGGGDATTGIDLADFTLVSFGDGRLRTDLRRAALGRCSASHRTAGGSAVASAFAPSAAAAAASFLCRGRRRSRSWHASGSGRRSLASAAQRELCGDDERAESWLPARAGGRGLQPRAQEARWVVCVGAAAHRDRPPSKHQPLLRAGVVIRSRVLAPRRRRPRRRGWQPRWTRRDRGLRGRFSAPASEPARRTAARPSPSRPWRRTACRRPRRSRRCRGAPTARRR